MGPEWLEDELGSGSGFPIDTNNLIRHMLFVEAR
jgi:hypothetical protein